MKNETDTDSLARMVAAGFSSMGKRFDAFEDRFDGMDTRFDAMDARFDRLERIVHETNQCIDKSVMPTQEEHAHRIKSLELAVFKPA